MDLTVFKTDQNLQSGLNLPFSLFTSKFSEKFELFCPPTPTYPHKNTRKNFETWEKCCNFRKISICMVLLMASVSQTASSSPKWWQKQQEPERLKLAAFWPRMGWSRKKVILSPRPNPVVTPHDNGILKYFGSTRRQIAPRIPWNDHAHRETHALECTGKTISWNENSTKTNNKRSTSQTKSFNTALQSQSYTGTSWPIGPRDWCTAYDAERCRWLPLDSPEKMWMMRRHTWHGSHRQRITIEIQRHDPSHHHPSSSSTYHII